MSISTGCRAQLDTMAKAQECRIGSGLPYFFKKLAGDQPVTIAYLGGSITEAKDGWRDQSLAWIQHQYPQTAVRQVNAAISGTGSDLGVFRLNQHVLVHKPDLIFVEFAVNDAAKKPEQIARAMEGIVRKIWRDNAQTDICFVYTLKASMSPLLSKGYLPLSASVMEQVADHYGIPSIHVGLDVVRLADQGELVFKGKPEEYPGKLVFSADEVHPYPQTGHRLYTEAIARSLVRMMGESHEPKNRLISPLLTDNWEDAQLISAKNTTHSAGWSAITPATDSVAGLLASRFSELLKATRPGERIRVRFRGTQFGVYDVMGPGCGQYQVIVDGQPAGVYPRFDEYCTYYRSHYFILPTLLDGVHVIELVVDDQRLDKAAILKKRNQSISNPKLYESKDCYAGQLLILGQLLEN